MQVARLNKCVFGAILLLAGCDRCESACELLYHGGRDNCAWGMDVSGEISNSGTVPVEGYEEACNQACEVTAEQTHVREIDEARSEWISCVLEKKSAVHEGRFKYYEPSQEGCSEAMSCGSSPCPDGELLLEGMDVERTSCVE